MRIAGPGGWSSDQLFGLLAGWCFLALAPGLAIGLPNVGTPLQDLGHTCWAIFGIGLMGQLFVFKVIAYRATCLSRFDDGLVPLLPALVAPMVLQSAWGAVPFVLVFVGYAWLLYRRQDWRTRTPRRPRNQG